MAYWGQARVLGPNINAMMESSEEPHALEMVQKAMSLKANASPREQALIEAGQIQAMGFRYVGVHRAAR